MTQYQKEMEVKQQLDALDPTFNVSTLIALNSKRHDDLRLAHEKLGEEQVRHIKEIADIRDLHAKEIRIGDMANAKSNADAQALAIQTLQAITNTNADNIRNTLNSTAATMAKNTTDLAQKIADEQRVREENSNKRIAVLEQSGWAEIGRNKINDPMMEKMIARMETMSEKMNENKGKETIQDPIIMKGLLNIQELLLAKQQGDGEVKGKGLAYSWVIALILAGIAVGGFIMDFIANYVNQLPAVIQP